MEATKIKIAAYQGVELLEWIDPHNKTPRATRPFILPLDSMQVMGLNPETARFLTCGPKTAAAYKAGDRVVFDSADTVLEDGCVFAISTQHGAICRRVFVNIDGSLLLRATFKGVKVHPEQKIAANKVSQLRVLGRVKFAVVFPASAGTP